MLVIRARIDKMLDRTPNLKVLIRLLLQFDLDLPGSLPCLSEPFLAGPSGNVYICLFVNIEIKTFGQQSQKSGLAIVKTIGCQHG